MSKEARKQGQAYRREARQILQKNQVVFNEKVQEKLRIFNECIRPKPKFFPAPLWRFFAKFFIDVPRLQKFLGVGQEQLPPQGIDLDGQAAVEIFKVMTGRLPSDGDDTLTLEDLNTFIARYTNNRRYNGLIPYAIKFRDAELSTQVVNK